MRAPEDMSREELEEEVAYWRSENAIANEDDQILRLRNAFGWGPSTCRYALALRQSKGRFVARWVLDGEVPSKQGRDSNTAAVNACLIRRSLGFGAIENEWARGYRLTPEGIAKIDQALNQQRSAA